MLGVGRTGRGGAGLRRRLRSARTLVLRTRTTTGRAAAASNLRRRSAAAAVRSAAAAARRWAATSGAGGGMAAAATPASGHRDASVEFSLSNQGLSEAEPQGARQAQAEMETQRRRRAELIKRSPTRLDPLGVRLPAQPSPASARSRRTAVLSPLCAVQQPLETSALPWLRGPSHRSALRACCRTRHPAAAPTRARGRSRTPLRRRRSGPRPSALSWCCCSRSLV